MTLTLRELVEGLLLLGLVLWALLTWIQCWQRGRARRRLARQRFFCELCLQVWRDEGEEPWQDCPHCGRSCERGREG